MLFRSGSLNAFVTYPLLLGSVLATDVTSTNGASVTLAPAVFGTFRTGALITLTATGTASANTQCQIKIAVDGSVLTHGIANTNTSTVAFWSVTITAPVSLSAGSHSISTVLMQTSTPSDTCSVLAGTYPSWGYHANLSVIGM